MLLKKQKNEAIQNARQSNFELLRIVAMFMIVLYHFGRHSEFYYEATAKQNLIYIDFIKCLGKIGNDIFVLISGYFLVKSEKTKIDKIFKIWIQIVTYSLGIAILSKVLDFYYINNRLAVSFSLENITDIRLGYCFPIGTRQWWFASTYFMLLLIAPFINKAITNLTKKEYRNMIFLLLFFWSVMPTITKENIIYESNSLLWFMTLYSVAGYIRLHADKTNISGKKYILIGLLVLVSWFAFVDITIPEKSIFSFMNLFKRGFNANEFIPVFAVALLLFVGFMKINIPYNRFINNVASTTFGIYLIHDSNIVRPFLWKMIVRGDRLAGSKWFIVYSIMATVSVFAVCSVIEFMRKRIIERSYEDKLHTAGQYIEKKIS